MTNDKMKAVLIHKYGGPEELLLVETTRPHPGAGQVQIRLHAAGVNPADWKMRAGLMQQFRPVPMPWTPGLEGAGTVSELGPGVTQFRVGQPVFGSFQGAYAEYAVAPVSDIQPKPESLTFEQAASIPVGALTAWGAVIDTAQVQAGQHVLVQGAAGGTGVYALQLAKWRGAHTIGTASTANLDLLRELGAGQVIDYTKEMFETQVHDLDVVVDTVGGDLPQRSLSVLRPTGLLVTIAGRLPPQFNPPEGIRVLPAGRAPVSILAQVARLIEEGKLTPVVGQIFDLGQASQAQELSHTGHGRGRIILRIAE